MIHIAWIEINEVIRAMGRQVMQKVFRQIAVGINDGNALALMDVLEDEIA